jgi:hypothetical protein
MKIYSVLKECSYDAPQVMLFTSLRKAVNYCQYEYYAHIESYESDETIEIDYKTIKECLNDEDEHFCWSSGIYFGETFSLVVTLHDKNNPIWFNDQHGGF